MKNKWTRRTILGAGILLAVFNITLFFIILFFDSETALKILSMVCACHIGGRLAFIGTGLELGIHYIPIGIIVLLYNTAYLLLVYSLFLFLTERFSKLKFITSLHQKVQESHGLRSRWNLLSIAVFVWIPLPMTGAVVGSLLAYFEGYEDRQILLIAIPAMWFGVISWTVAFDQMYHVFRNIDTNMTAIITLLLIILPIIYNVVKKNKTVKLKQN